MIQVQCPGCMTQVFLECTCPPEHLLTLGEHHDECPHSDIDANLACAPDAGCCSEDHDHAAMANACPGGHENEACPEEPGRCRVWRDSTADARHPLYRGAHPLLGPDHAADDDIPPCPGGHCHASIPSCTVCRPLIITMLPGSAEVTLAGQVS